MFSSDLRHTRMFLRLCAASSLVMLCIALALLLVAHAGSSLYSAASILEDTALVAFTATLLGLITCRISKGLSNSYWRWTESEDTRHFAAMGIVNACGIVSETIIPYPEFARWAFTAHSAITLIIMLGMFVRMFIRRPAKQVGAYAAASESPTNFTHHEIAPTHPFDKAPESFQESLGSIWTDARELEPDEGRKVLESICKNVTDLFSRPGVETVKGIDCEAIYAIKLGYIPAMAESLKQIADALAQGAPSPSLKNDVAKALQELQTFNEKIEADLKKSNVLLSRPLLLNAELLNL